MTRHPKAFSLLELVVVLAILAALTTVALRSVNSAQSQARYQQTVGTLTNLHDAITTGFVADIGRLPQTIAGPEPLGELLAANGIPNFAFATSAYDPTVRLGVGWQGPYVNLPIGASALRDGWGNPYQYRDNANAVIGVTNVAVAQIRSLAADKIADDNGGLLDGYNLDVSTTIPATGKTGIAATFLGNVRRLDASGINLIAPPAVGDPVDPSNPTGDTYATVSVSIYYFGPDVSAPPYVADIPLTNVISPWNFELTGDTTVPAGTNILKDNRITIGPRVLKAYYTYTTTGGSTFTGSSPALYVTGTGGGQTVPTLVLPNP